MSATRTRATVFLVDDDPSIRKSVSRLLDSAGYAVSAFESAEHFLERHCHEGPGCLILDVQLPGIDGLTLQEQIAHCEDALPIIFISGHGDIPMSVRALKTGALDFLPKPFDADALLKAVGAAVQKDACEAAQHAERRALRCRHAALTPREREVFAHLLTGKLNKQIGAAIGITEKTVKYHRANVLRKFGVTSTAELVRIAGKLGTLPPN